MGTVKLLQVREPVRHTSSALVFAILIGVVTSSEAQVTVLFDEFSNPEVCIDASSNERLPCPDYLEYVMEAQMPLQNAFSAHKYQEIDRLYTQWRTGKDRFPNGRWKLSSYSKTLYEFFSGWKTWDKFFEQIKSWQKLAPDSEAAQIAEANYWRAFAWNARGSGYAKSVSKEAWQLFEERLQKARKVVDAIDSSCPTKYPILIDLMIDLGADESELRPVYDDAIKRFPEYHNIYLAMARRYSPAWGGSRAAYERFADEATSATEAFEGKAMYARLYWDVDSEGGVPFTGIPDQSPEWEKLKRSLEDLTTRYPKSQHNLGQFLSVACRSSDSALYRKLRAQLTIYANSAKTYDPLEVCDLRHHWESPDPMTP